MLITCTCPHYVQENSDDDENNGKSFRSSSRQPIKSTTNDVVRLHAHSDDSGTEERSGKRRRESEEEINREMRDFAEFSEVFPVSLSGQPPTKKQRTNAGFPADTSMTSGGLYSTEKGKSTSCGEEPGCPQAPFPHAALYNEPLQNLPGNPTPNVNLFQDTADTSNTVYPTDEQEEITVLGPDDDKVVRQAFIFKVFLVLTMQLFITSMVVALFTFQEKLKTFVRENCWPWYVSFVTFLLVFIGFGCSEGFRHKHPWNLVPMLLLTLSMSYMTEAIASCFNANVIIMAAAITVVLCFTVVIFSLWCKCDFTSCASVLLVCAIFIFIFGIVCTFISNDILLTVYNPLGMLLSSCFLAVVTQLFLGNKKLSLSPKEHMFGALSGYLIIIVIFFHSLHIAKSGLFTNFIPDRSRPGLTTTAIGAVDLQGAGGNWATVGRRSRGGRRVRRQREKRKGKSVGLRIGTLNVGTMTGKGRELADVMERRKVDILCVQETRWKGSKARSIGAGFKLFYYGVDSKRNGVGVVLKEEFVRNVLEVKRVSDRVMSLKLEIEGVMLNVVSGYAPQVGCELEEKERFWSELDEVMESIPTGERVVIGADFNGHVGEGNTGDEEVMGKFGVKERNLEGQMVVDFAKRMDMGVVNTYFQKREEHRVTYKSGGRSTQVDYILCRRGNLKEISDCKVVVGESVARQHRMVVCRMTLMVCKKKRSEIEKKTKWWKLKKEECCEEFRQKLRQALGGQVVLPDDWETTAEVIRETGRKVLGVSSGRRKEDKETWWWNEEVQDSIQRKRLAKKKWDMDRTEENRQEYKELQRRVKREVSKAKQKAYDELYTRLDTREGEKDLYRLARQRDRDGKDVQQVRVIKDRDGRVLTSEESVQRRWKEYFEELMNEENEREKRVEGVNSVEQKVDKIRKDEVRKALKRMKSGKAVGPDDIPVEVWKCLGEAAVEFLASLFNRVLESERMPEEWRRSVLVPIFKNKGDVQSCSNYRGIKLMSHTMKVWERVVEARLRKVVEICEQQYGFMPRKSTTDAIFALRILMEKYRDGQRELHCVFVDLEKAYDRVPREELWYCMRKSGVAEKYVRVVQDMYERSRTVVRCAVGQTEEFNVEVGLHQGSALSPFLFAIVMDQLSEEVRQESPWTMMFADDIVICSESREQVEESLERWRFALERRGMKVSRSKTEYMCVNEREGSGTVRLQGEEVKKVQEFKYLGSTVQSNGECGKEVKKRVQAGWNGWRKVSGVLCDQKISARIKGKVYRTVVRPAMLYGLETVSLRKRQESELEVAELKMLRFSLGVTRLDRIRNEYIRGTAHVGRLGDKVREARLRWFGHVQRRE
ncbi:hypothetical protein QTP70_019711, partial [Hemibagrus guttatus]